MADGRIKMRTLLSASGLWTRRNLRKIKKPVETANGPVGVGDDVVLGAEWQEFTLQGTTIAARYSLAPVVLLHKPLGCVTSRRTADGSATVFEFVDDPAVEEVEPVGRLDKETSGVLLFAADGQLLHRLTHPKYGIVRTYRAELAAPLSPSGRDRLLAGAVELDDGYAPRPARLDVLDEDATRIEVDLTSGKYHEVRRMFAAVGCPVEVLHRTEYAGVRCDDLPAGTSRRLDDKEVTTLLASVGMDPVRDFLEIDVLDG